MNNIVALTAELRALEWWDQTEKKAGPEYEINRAGIEARQMRRVEIISEIDTLLKSDVQKWNWDVAPKIPHPPAHQPIEPASANAVDVGGVGPRGPELRRARRFRASTPGLRS